MPVDDFRYVDSWLSDFGFTMIGSEEEQQFVGRTIEKAEITSLRARPNHYGVVYNDVLTLNFLIVKTDWICGGSDELGKLRDSEINYLRGWLESPKLPELLHVDLEDHDLVTNYFGLFTDVQPYVLDGDCYGLKLTFTCDSPYGYSEEHVETYDVGVNQPNLTGTFINGSVEYKETQKPIITITSTDTFGRSGTLTIKNVTDGNKTMSITLPSSLSSLVIDCDNRVVKDGDGNLVPLSDLGVTLPIGDNYNYISTEQYFFYWLEFLPGINELEFSTNSSNTIQNIKISSRDIIKSGGF